MGDSSNIILFLNFSIFDLHEAGLNYAYYGIDSLNSITFIPDELNAPGSPSGSFLCSIQHTDSAYIATPNDWSDFTDNGITLEEITLQYGRTFPGGAYDNHNDMLWSLSGIDDDDVNLRVHDSTGCFRKEFSSPFDNNHEGLTVDGRDPTNVKMYISHDSTKYVSEYAWDISAVGPCYPMAIIEPFPSTDRGVSADDDEEVSGIVYNPYDGNFIAISESGKGKIHIIDQNNVHSKFTPNRRGTGLSYDFEGITIADIGTTIIYIADERTGKIWEYDYAARRGLRVFTPNPPLPNDGLEAIVFLPDDPSVASGSVTGVFLLAMTDTGNIYEYRVGDLYDQSNKDLTFVTVHTARFCKDAIRGGTYNWDNDLIYWIYHGEDDYIASQPRDMSCVLQRWEHPSEMTVYGQREGMAFRPSLTNTYDLFMTGDNDRGGQFFDFPFDVPQATTCPSS